MCKKKLTAEWNLLVICLHVAVSSAKCLLCDGHNIFSKAN